MAVEGGARTPRALQDTLNLSFWNATRPSTLERMWVEAGELLSKVVPALQAAVLRAALKPMPRPMRHWVRGELRAMLPR